MRTKIIALVMVAVFLGSLFAGTAWAEERAKAENQKSYKGYFIFKWIKLFFRVLKLERSVSLLKKSVRKLNADLEKETMERQSGDRRLKLIIDDEAETREKDDIALGEEIDNEAAAREQGDEGLANALKDETAARTEADEDLQKQIDSIETGTAKHPIFFTSGKDQILPAEDGMMGVGHLSTNFAYGIVTPMTGTITDLIGYSIAKQDLPDNESISFTLYKNNDKTEVFCEITAKDDQCSNLEDSITVKVGDKLRIFVAATSQVTATEVGASVVLESAGTRNFNEPVLHE